MKKLLICLPFLLFICGCASLKKSKSTHHERTKDSTDIVIDSNTTKTNERTDVQFVKDEEGNVVEIIYDTDEPDTSDSAFDSLAIPPRDYITSKDYEVDIRTTYDSATGIKHTKVKTNKPIKSLKYHEYKTGEKKDSSIEKKSEETDYKKTESETKEKDIVDTNSQKQVKRMPWLIQLSVAAGLLIFFFLIVRRFRQKKSPN